MTTAPRLITRDAQLGRTLGEYQILAELARGGMGQVYLAARRGVAGFARYFAVKVMHREFLENRDVILMLLDEAHIASRLHHPNIVPVVDAGTYEGGYYLVMEYVEGCSLGELMFRNPDVRPARLIIPIVLDALNGLHAVHELTDAAGRPCNVVHRDISPQNLMVGRDGGCRVTDFGIAKAADRFSATSPGMNKGKLAFMAPEQLDKLGPIDRRADIWSVGVTLYAALTGRSPFRGPTPSATMDKILGGDIPPPSQVGLHPPSALDDVVMRALRIDREARYGDAREFAEQLRSVAIEHDLLGSPAEIAKWVESSYGDELTARRRAISELMPLDSESRENLPQLWLTGSHAGLALEPDSAEMGSQPPPSSASLRPIASGVQKVLQPQDAPAPSSKHRWVLPIAVALVCAVLGAVVGLLIPAADEDPDSPSAPTSTPTSAAEPDPDRATTPALGSAAQAADAPSMDPSHENVGDTLPEPSTQSEDTLTPAREDERVDDAAFTATGSVGARPAHRRRRGRTPRTAEPTSEETTAPSPEPSPPPRPEHRLERNPYLRGE